MKYIETFSYKIHALTYTIDTLASAVLKANSKINFPQFLILLCFIENQGQTQRFAADWLQLTEATVSYMIKRMVKEGHLRVELNPHDKRNKKIYATRKGVKEINHIYPLLEEALAKHIQQLSSSQIDLMIKDMDIIKKSIIRDAKKE